MDHKEDWAPKNWCFWIVMLENTLESLLDSKEIKSSNPKGNQPWIFIGRTGAETEAPILWPPDAKSWLIENTLMLGKIEGRRRRGWQRMRWLNWITNSMDMNSSKLWEIVEDRGAWQAAAHGVAECRTQLRPNFRSHPAWETVHLWHLAPSLKCLGHCWVVRSQHLASGGLNHRCTTYQGSRADYFTSLSLGHLFYKTGTIKKLPL